MRHLIAWAILSAALLRAQPISEAKLAAIGNAMAAEFRRSHTVFHCPEADSMLARIGPQVVSALGGGTYSYALVTGDWPAGSAEPFVFHGGHVFIPAEVFLRADSEYAFVFALAHGIAHLQLSHFRTQSPAGIPLFWNPASILPLAAQAHKARWEREADEFARATLEKAGFKASGEQPDPEWEAIQKAVRAAVDRKSVV